MRLGASWPMGQGVLVTVVIREAACGLLTWLGGLQACDVG